jgi:hypothetical protein
MNYKVKDVIGLCLEAGAIAGIAVAVKYDAHLLAYAVGGAAYTAGRNLRNEALEEKIELRQRQELTDKL